MKKLFTLAFLALSISSGYAQNTLRQAFIEMPDSLFPYLTKNNRLDMLDFMDANMKAEVTNKLDNKSEMTALAADSIVLRLSPASAATFYLVPVEQEVDSAHFVIAVMRTYSLSEKYFERKTDFYSLRWYPLTKKPALSENWLLRLADTSTLLKRDEEIFNSSSK